MLFIQKLIDNYITLLYIPSSAIYAAFRGASAYRAHLSDFRGCDLHLPTAKSMWGQGTPFKIRKRLFAAMESYCCPYPILTACARRHHVGVYERHGQRCAS